MNNKVFFLAIVILFMLPNLSLAAFTVNSEGFLNVIKQLDMQGHADDELSTCSVKQMYYEEVLEMFNNGKSEQEILQSYINEYGQAALRTPATDKSGWVAWGMPFAGLGIGIAIVSVRLKKVKGKVVQNQLNPEGVWESEIEKEITEKAFDEERRKYF